MTLMQQGAKSAIDPAISAATNEPPKKIDSCNGSGHSWLNAADLFQRGMKRGVRIA